MSVWIVCSVGLFVLPVWPATKLVGGIIVESSNLLFCEMGLSKIRMVNGVRVKAMSCQWIEAGRGVSVRVGSTGSTCAVYMAGYKRAQHGNWNVTLVCEL